MIFYECKTGNLTQLAPTQADAKARDKGFKQVDLPTDKPGLMGFVNGLYQRIAALSSPQVAAAEDADDETDDKPLVRRRGPVTEHPVLAHPSPQANTIERLVADAKAKHAAKVAGLPDHIVRGEDTALAGTIARLRRGLPLDYRGGPDDCPSCFRTPKGAEFFAKQADKDDIEDLIDTMTEKWQLDRLEEALAHRRKALFPPAPPVPAPRVRTRPVIAPPAPEPVQQVATPRTRVRKPA